MKKIWIIVLSIVVVLTLYFIIVHNDLKEMERIEEGIFNNILNRSIIGKVNDKYIDYENHHMKLISIVEIDDTFELALNFDRSKLFERICVNDSIIKKSNSNLVIIISGSNKDTFYVDHMKPPRKIIPYPERE